MASTTCGWCGHFSHMASLGTWKETYDPEENWYELYNSYSCGCCARTSSAVLYTLQPTNSASPREIEEQMNRFPGELEWTPKHITGKAFKDVPTHVASAAIEAHKRMSVSAFRGVVALARAVVEATAKEKSITSGQLHQKINRLLDDGHIRPLIKDAAHEIRYLGNEVAHGDFTAPVTKEEAVETLRLMDDLLKEVFQMPARVERRRKAREAKKEFDKTGDRS